MSVRTKFGVLLGLMLLAVLLALGTAWWTLDTMQREVRDPFKSMTEVLADLADAKGSVEAAGRILIGPSRARSAGVRVLALDPDAAAGPFDLDGFRGALSEAHAGLHRVADNDWSKTRVGASTVPNLRDRLSMVDQMAARVPDADRRDRVVIASGLYEVHELIERIERRIIDDTTEALRYGGELRARLLLILALALVIALLTIALGFALVRRWVLHPVALLRDAAARIAAGDLEHRIPLPPDGGRDELALLSAEVNQMAGTIKSMQDRRVDQERLAAIGEMVRRLAHNLRNPLGGIRGLAELTRSELPSTNRDLAENQTRIIAAVDRFSKWLDDLLGVTRPMQVHPGATDVGPWIAGLVDAHRPQAETKQVELALDLSHAPAIAAFDARHLEHAVSAILSNAIEATSHPSVRANGRRGRVTIFVRESGPSVVLGIEDEGQGIPLESQDKVFQPYFTTKPDGNGIGLAVALQVVTAHGGRITVDSPWPKRNPDYVGNGTPLGTRFTIEIPTNRPVLASESESELAKLGQ